MDDQQRPLHSLGESDLWQTFKVTLRGGSGEVHTWEYQGRFADGAPIGHEAYRFKDADGKFNNLHHPDWAVTPCPDQSTHHVQLAAALGVVATDHDWTALLSMVTPVQPIANMHIPPIFSVRGAIAETDLPPDMSSAQAIRTLWSRLGSTVDTSRKFTEPCGRYSVTFEGGSALVIDTDDRCEGNRARSREWVVPRSGDGWSEVAGDDVWLEVKPAVVVVIHIPWDHKAGPSQRVCT